MKIFNKKLILNLFVVSLVFCFAGPIAASAASPSLGAAASYGILSGTYTNTNPTTVNGNIGFTTGPGALGDIVGHPSGTYPYYGSGAPYATAQSIDAFNALNILNALPCTNNLGAVVDLSLVNGATYTPGVYCSTGAMSIGGGGITLNGDGTYVFRANGALHIVTGSTVHLNGVCANDVFWTPTAATTFDANTNFSGTIIDNANAITVGGNTTWTGRAISLGAGVATTDTDIITVPTCVATLTLVKIIIGGTKSYTDFPLTATGPTTITGVYPAPAITNATVDAGTYILSETAQPNYTAEPWSCTKNPGAAVTTGASITLASGDSAICTVQNDYVGPLVGGNGGAAAYFNPPVAPLIDVVKVPSPLALPNGPGPVTYTYTLRNIGTVPMSGVTMVDDTCGPVIFISGDTNGDSKLDVDETWTYDCSTTLSVTHTNTVVATGWANGVSATDIATATVVVGVPIVPPLIHVTKIPSPLALPAGGGMVTYTKEVTNPGIVPLSNVQLVDDKCSPVQYISGDNNGNGLLDTNETWTYTCSTNLTKTTTNTVVATGQANGLTASDFAIATVVAAVPKLPNTGFPPEQKTFLWNIIMLAGIIMLVLASLVLLVRKGIALAKH